MEVESVTSGGRHHTEQFGRMVEAVEDYAVFMLDPDGRIATWNAEGYAREDVLGRPLATFYPPEDQGTAEQAIETARRTGTWTGEGWRVRENGTRFWASATLTAVRGDDGALVGFAIVMRDLTERRAREKELERERALVALMQEVTNAVHEADTLDAALKATMEAVCRHTAWPIGHAYRRATDEPTRFVSTGIWSLADAERSTRFRALTETTTFALGEGLVGRVAHSGKPEWISDVTEAGAPYARPEAVPDLGVRGALGLPVRHNDETVAVLAFYAAERNEPDAKLLEVITSVGQQLSRVVEREALRRTQRRATHREGEERYRMALRNAPVVFAHVDRELRYEWIYNPHPDFEESAVVGKRDDELDAGPGIDALVALKRRVFERGEQERREITFERSGGARTYDITATPVRDADGGVRRVVTAALDITDQKHAERALRASEAKFRALAEESQVGIAVIQDGRFRYVNGRYGEIYGYAPEELIDTIPAEQLIHPEDRPLQREMMRRRIEGEADAVRFQCRIVRKDGETRHVEVHGRRFMYQGRPAVVGSVLDVTERHRLQREVLKVQAEERRRIGQDLHDGVASQLTGIGVMLSVLMSRESMSEAAEEELGEIRGLLDDSLRDIRQLSHGLAPAGLSGKDLSGALERVAKIVEGGHFEQEGEVPAVGDEVAAHLYYIAQEAAVNAQKYAAAQRITIRLSHSEGTLALEVEDDGKGFDLAGEGPEESLGLRTMRYRAELLGAAFSIDTAPGRGTRVRCRLAA